MNEVHFIFTENLSPQVKNYLYQFVEQFPDDLVSPTTIEAFYKFAFEYCRCNNHIAKDEFVKYVKKFNHITRDDKRGMAQRFYKELETIQRFYKYNKNKTL